jgi:hypothetical protein
VAARQSATPGSLEPRYDHLTGGEAGRSVLYAFRRQLGMSVADVKALQWWEYQLLLEGMVTESEASNGGGGTPDTDEGGPGGFQPMGLDELGIVPIQA